MRGNLTPGPYDKTANRRPVPQPPLSQASHPNSFPPSQGLYIPTASEASPKNTATSSQRDSSSKSITSHSHQLKSSKTATKNGRPGRSNRIVKGSHNRASSFGTQLPPSWRKHQPRRPSASLKSETSAMNHELQRSLWLRPSGTTAEAVFLITHYDSSCNSSLISKTAALRMDLRTMPCTPALRLSIMTDFGIVEPEEFVMVDVEAPWLKNSELGKCNVTVVSGNILESQGIEFLAGKRILQKLRDKGRLPEETQAQIDIGFRKGHSRPKTMPSIGHSSVYHTGADANTMQLCGASEYLQPRMGTRNNPFAPSNTSVSGGASFPSTTNEAGPESTTWTSFVDTRSPVEDISNSQPSFNSGFKEILPPSSQVSSDVFGIDSQLSPSQVALEGPVGASKPALDITPSAFGQQDIECISPYSQAQSNQTWEPYLGGQGYAFLSYISPYAASPVAASSSEGRENYISEDSAPIYQGMTDWTSLPSYHPSSEVQSLYPLPTTPVPEIRVETMCSDTPTPRNQDTSDKNSEY